MSDRLVSHDIKYRTERSDVKHGHSGTRADGVASPPDRRG
jgi:hypothetical protein